MIEKQIQLKQYIADNEMSFVKKVEYERELAKEVIEREGETDIYFVAHRHTSLFLAKDEDISKDYIEIETNK